MDDLWDTLKKIGAIQQGHFLLSSGRHSDVYFEKFRILERPDLLARLCEPIVQHFQPHGVQVVIGPTVGGALVAYEVARQLHAQALYAERDSQNKRTLRRGATLPKGTRTLIVDDVLTTGLSLREVLALANEYKAHIVGIGVLVNRAEEEILFDVPLFAALRLEARSYPPEDVPEWLARIPLSHPGSRPLPPNP